MRNDYKGESTLSISAKQLAEIVGAAVASTMAQPQKRERWIPVPEPIGPYSESYPDSVLYAREDDVAPVLIGFCIEQYQRTKGDGSKGPDSGQAILSHQGMAVLVLQTPKRGLRRVDHR
jgi:hypothetical protein